MIKFLRYLKHKPQHKVICVGDQPNVILHGDLLTVSTETQTITVDWCEWYRAVNEVAVKTWYGYQVVIDTLMDRLCSYAKG